MPCDFKYQFIEKQVNAIRSSMQTEATATEEERDVPLRTIMSISHYAWMTGDAALSN
jgi:hypothetical protein